MALKKTYTKIDVQAALDLAEGHKFSSFTSVWGGNDSHFKTKEHKDKEGKVRATTTVYSPGAEAEKISDDVGHTKRNHVKGHQESAYVGTKSRFDDVPGKAVTATGQSKQFWITVRRQLKHAV